MKKLLTVSGTRSFAVNIYYKAKYDSAQDRVSWEWFCNFTDLWTKLVAAMNDYMFMSYQN
jgi:hypothetical protein